MLLRRAIFLDRDGIINYAIVHGGRSFAPRSFRDFKVYEDFAELAQRLRDLDYLLVVVTNQPDVAKGSTPRCEVEAMHRVLVEEYHLDAIMVCYHQDSDGCMCRKPLPGMILEAAQRYEIAVPQSYLVGDRWRDIAAGRAAGCHSIFVDRGYCEQAPCEPQLIVKSLREAVTYIETRHLHIPQLR